MGDPVSLNAQRSEFDQDTILERGALQALKIPDEAITTYLEALAQTTAQKVGRVVSETAYDPFKRFHLLKRLFADNQLDIDPGAFSQLRVKLFNREPAAIEQILPQQNSVKAFCALWNLLAQREEEFQANVPTYLRKAVADLAGTKDIKIMTLELAEKILAPDFLDPALTNPLDLLRSIMRDGDIIAGPSTTSTKNIVHLPQAPHTLSTEEINKKARSDWDAYGENFLKTLSSTLEGMVINDENLEKLKQDIADILEAHELPTFTDILQAHDEFRKVIDTKIVPLLKAFSVKQAIWGRDEHAQLLNALKITV